MIYSCELPYPPSVNKAYGGGSGQQRFKSKAYKAWERSCPKLVLPECGAIDWPVSVVYRFFLPDARLRDISNLEKCTTDQLVKQCIFMDDNFKIIQHMHLQFAGVDRDNPRVEIEVYKIKENAVAL